MPSRIKQTAEALKAQALEKLRLRKSSGFKKAQAFNVEKLGIFLLGHLHGKLGHRNGQLTFAAKGDLI